MSGIRLSLLLFCFSVVCFQAGASSSHIQGAFFNHQPSADKHAILVADAEKPRRFGKSSKEDGGCTYASPIIGDYGQVTKAVQDFAGKARDASEITVASLVEKSSDAYKALSHHVRNHPTESASIAFTGAALVGLRLKFSDSKASKPAAPAKNETLISFSWSKLSNAANSLALPPLLAESASLARRWVNASQDALNNLFADFTDSVNVDKVQGTAQGKMLYSGNFVLDLQKRTKVGGLLIWNKPGSYKSSKLLKGGSRDFMVEVSTDGKKWTKVHQGWLNPGPPICSSQYVAFKGHWARYVRFTTLRAYKDGAGLSKIEVIPSLGLPATWFFLSRPTDVVQSLWDSRYPEMWGEVEVPLEEFDSMARNLSSKIMSTGRSMRDLATSAGATVAGFTRHHGLRVQNATKVMGSALVAGAKNFGQTLRSRVISASNSIVEVASRRRTDISSERSSNAFPHFLALVALSAAMLHPESLLNTRLLEVWGKVTRREEPEEKKPWWQR